jgi:hypothetical protein
MWIYVICKECGRNVARAPTAADFTPSLRIEMDDGGVAAELLECVCERCAPARPARVRPSAWADLLDAAV